MAGSTTATGARRAASTPQDRPTNSNSSAPTTQSRRYNPLKMSCPLREAPFEADRYDEERIAKYSQEYLSQSDVLLIRDRQIEYNARMLCGQQRSIWHPTLGQFFDVQTWLPDAEKAWRQLVVINKEQRWFTITHARLTENPPILTVLPGPDRSDAELAEVLDSLFKLDWRQAGMEAVHDELMMWLVVAGRAHAISRIDPNAGEWRPWIAEERIPRVDWNGELLWMDGQMLMSEQAIPNIPLAPDGSPNAVMAPDGSIHLTGEPHMERTGGIAVDVYSPLQVRGQWGPAPWHKKTWHTVQRFLTPEQVFDAWGVEVEPDLAGQAAANVATLERVLYGSGFYGQTLGRVGTGWVDSRVKGDLCTVYERWAAPVPFNEKLVGTWAEPMMQTPKEAGGRQTVWTPKAMIRDGARDVAWPSTSPVRTYDFVRLPGRPSGVTPLETLHGSQRAYNASRQQAMEHAALLGNPQIVVDANCGIQASQITNAPGEIYVATKQPNVAPIEYVAAPSLSADVYKMIEYSSSEIDELGGLMGTEGQAPTDDASGELVKELRFNADRLLGATARRTVTEYARMADDWRALYPIIYTDETVIAINGEDNVAQTISVLPTLFQQGRVNVIPDVESMLPEGRGERQSAARWNWQNGAFGDPASEQARDIYLEQARYPSYGRMSRPGGVDRVMAQQENGKILMGQLEQPVLEWYDHFVHLMVHERFMKSPEFLKQPMIVQQAFAIHRMLHLQFVLRMQASMTPPAPQGQIGAGGGEPDEAGNPSMAGEAAPPKSVAAEGAESPTTP